MLKINLNSNIIKIIAILCMIIDHIGVYMARFLSEDMYYIFRSVGRCAMPIFSYFLVQGFFYTKDIKKYIFRIFCLATITQISLLLVGILNEIKFSWYITSINSYLNIVYSYTFSLILLYVIHNKVIIKNLNNTINFLFRLILIIIIGLIYNFIRIEFDLRIPFIFIELYIIERIFMNKEFNKPFLHGNYKILQKIVYLICIILVFGLSLFFSKYNPGFKYALLFSIIPISLYNGQRGRNSKFIKIAFYMVFPIQHIVLYIFSMVLY